MMNTPEYDPLGVAVLHARREFTKADGELVRIEVDVNRFVSRGPVIVSSLRAQPRGRHYRYHQHVEPGVVWRVVLDWLRALPDDYAACEDCTDVRAAHWGRLTTLLGLVPCIVMEDAK